MHRLHYNDKQTETLINTAEFIHAQGQPVPVDVLARLLAAGIDVQKFQQQTKD
jgi:hypothetical protein